MPKVTVITPNYNHARYLPRRLDSILTQTFQDFELIILDDASTDSSRDVIKSYANEPRVKTIFNAENTGSTFSQWNLGLSHARGDYVWFAESDDYADPSLLETLVDRLDRHPRVGLAFCQSWVIDQDNNISYNYLEMLERFNKSSRWRSDYVNSGQEECANFMFLYNTIPNASAVLLRRDILQQAGGAPAHMRLCGDWMTYINVLSISDVAFVSAPLNYFRHHSTTVRSRYLKQGIPLREMKMIHRALIKRYGRRRVFRERDDTLIPYIGILTHESRRPEDYKLSLGKALGLLMWFAWVHPRAFRIAFPWLWREQQAELARVAKLISRSRKVRSSTESSTLKNS